MESQRPKHSDKRTDEPFLDWGWMRFSPTPINEEMQKRDKPRYDMELEAEKETDRDLTKSIPQLVCDFNFEAQKAERIPAFPLELRLLLKAQSHMVAMMAQVAIKHEEVSKQIVKLTNEITWLNRGILFFGVLTIAFIIFSYFHPLKP
jgi:hypothetical protein